MIVLALLTAFAAFALLALASDRHHDRWTGIDRRWRRLGGWALLAVSSAAAFAGWGLVYGAIGGFGLAMLAAGANLLIFNLTRR